jgi:aromatic-L-amino-acid decarboxylase
VLDLPPDEVRRLGHQVVDAYVEHLERLREAPPISTAPRALLDAVLREPVPEEPGDPAAAIDLLVREVLPHVQHGDHPRFFARVPSPSNPVAPLADALAAGFNAFAGSWAGGSGPAAVELLVLDWLRALLGLSASVSGILLSGGSVSSLTALATARAERGGHVVWVSDQTHASVLRAARVLGLEPRVLPSDGAFRLPPEAIPDEPGGCAVVATAGTTNTGAVDPLAELGALCRERGLWLHVDGAYGAPAAMAGALDGLEHADSLAVDPHKWLFVNYECGALLVREPAALHRTFAMAPEYLRDVLGDEVDFRDRGPQLSRGSRALKLWLSLKTFGAAAYRAAIARSIALAERAEAQLREQGFEIVTPAQLAIVTFAAPDAEALAAAMLADGYALPSTTVLRGRTVLRLCTLNPRTTDAEIDATVARLAALARPR